VDNHFGVGMCGKAMAAAFQFVAKTGKIINFAVEDYPDGSIFVEDGLVASGKVNDAEPAHSQPGVILDEDAFVIRTAIHDRLAHAVDRLFVNSALVFLSYNPSNAAHALAFQH
jgi:hypothetical protein